MIRPAAAALGLMLAAGPASANDSMAELRTNGLIFVKTGSVEMVREDLFVSAEEVRVDYVFRNAGTADETNVVAFPMPDIKGDPYTPVAIPYPGKENFLGFTVTVDGREVEPNIQHRAEVVGIDVTDEIAAAGVSLLPFDEIPPDALPEEVRADWLRRGIILLDQYDIGEGMKDHYAPYWTLKTTYWWEMTFPAGKEVRVSHRYTPSVGGTVAVSFVEDGKLQGDTYRDYVGRYCMDETFERAVAKSIPADNPYGAPYAEKRIAYVLTTGQNWAGPIGTFHLTVDKGSPDSLVSFCGEGVEKTGPTTFEMTATDFWPMKDLDVLILERLPQQ
jgi:hypothetical protein